MRLCFTSDFHGYLPQIEKCDMLFICGDICPVWNHNIMYQKHWLETYFHKWLKEIQSINNEIKIVLVAGNHCSIFENAPQLIPKLPVYYLENSGIELNGMKIWGSPYSVQFGHWSFMDTDARLQQYWEKIPDDTNILLTHGPAYGILDWSRFGNEHTGSKTLLNKIESLKELKIFHSGHIHSEYGITKYNNITCINGSYLDDYYKIKNKPHYLEF